MPRASAIPITLVWAAGYRNQCPAATAHSAPSVLLQDENTAPRAATEESLHRKKRRDAIPACLHLKPYLSLKNTMAEHSSTACSEAILTLKISEVVLQGMVQLTVQ